MAQMEQNGAVKLTNAQLDALTKAAFTFKPGEGGGCPHASVNKDFIGKDPIVLAKAAGVNIPGRHAACSSPRRTRIIRSWSRNR